MQCKMHSFPINTIALLKYVNAYIFLSKQYFQPLALKLEMLELHYSFKFIANCSE